jgi:hypothetical protein
MANPNQKHQRVNGRRSHAEMAEILGRGEVIIHNGEVITSTDQLPSPAELVMGDPAAEQEALNMIEASIKSLQAQRDDLRTPADARPPLPQSPPRPPMVKAASDNLKATARTPEDLRAEQRASLLAGTVPKSAPADEGGGGGEGEAEGEGEGESEGGGAGQTHTGSTG